MSSIAGKIIDGVRWIISDAGVLLGYRNPVSDSDEPATFGGSSDAADINIADAGSNFAATNVEDALTELAEGGGVGWSSQFAIRQSILPSRTVNVSATGQAYLGACAIAGIRCITPGSSGTLTIHDASAASDATLLRFSRAYSTLTADAYYPMVSDDPSAMLFATGAYVTITGSGVFALDLLDGTAITGLAGTGVLCEVARVTSSSVALADPSNIVSIRIIDRGTTGTFAVYDGTSTGGALRFQSRDYLSLTNGDLFKFGSRGGSESFSNLYLTMPTNGIALVNYLPR